MTSEARTPTAIDLRSPRWCVDSGDEWRGGATQVPYLRGRIAHVGSPSQPVRRIWTSKYQGAACSAYRSGTGRSLSASYSNAIHQRSGGPSSGSASVEPVTGILPGVRKPVLEPQNRLDSTVRKDTMQFKETERPAMVAGRMSYGKCRVRCLRTFCETFPVSTGVSGDA